MSQGGGSLEAFESSVISNGYRTYREGWVPAADLADMLCGASALSADDGIDYSLCGLVDGPTERIAVNLPGKVLNASAWSSFNWNTDCLDDPTAPVPGEGLRNLASALFSLSDYGSTELVTDKIMLAGHPVPSGSVRCTAETAVDWPFDDVIWSKSGSAWTVEVESPVAGEIRTFLRQHYQDFEQYWMACVVRDGVIYYVYYDDVPDDEALFPF